MVCPVTACIRRPTGGWYGCNKETDVGVTYFSSLEKWQGCYDECKFTFLLANLDMFSLMGLLVLMQAHGLFSGSTQ